jgi:hypothetical protein
MNLSRAHLLRYRLVASGVNEFSNRSAKRRSNQRAKLVVTADKSKALPYLRSSDHHKTVHRDRFIYTGLKSVKSRKEHDGHGTTGGEVHRVYRLAAI